MGPRSKRGRLWAWIYLSISEKEENREMTREDLKSLASSFAERMGSYSNQSDYGNMSDLKLFMIKTKISPLPTGFISPYHIPDWTEKNSFMNWYIMALALSHLI